VTVPRNTRSEALAMAARDCGASTSLPNARTDGAAASPPAGAAAEAPADAPGAASGAAAGLNEGTEADAPPLDDPFCGPVESVLPDPLHPASSTPANRPMAHVRIPVMW
ncbi:MAG TPA: hypothetical protein PK219_11755, partial [Dermatophilaceae bacterium]|nr:hypothetical protein [Dermatophilaceae bacterium]